MRLLGLLINATIRVTDDTDQTDFYLNLYYPRDPCPALQIWYDISYKFKQVT